MLETDTWLMEKDRIRIQRATCMPQLLTIAMQVIRRNRNGLPVIQVCGPMCTGGGTLRSNTAMIASDILAFRNAGLSVFSQVSFQCGMLNFITEAEYRANPLPLLEGFYGALFRGGYIDVLAFRPGWKKSLGSTWEHDTGRDLGLRISPLSGQRSQDIRMLVRDYGSPAMAPRATSFAVAR